MNMKITPRPLAGRVTDTIASKSHAHRAMICAALADAPTLIHCNSTSKDVHATAGCIEALGARAMFGSDTILVTPIGAAGQGGALLDCCESGSTLRFMLPLVGALGRECAFIGRGKLAERPLSPLYEQLIAHGMHMSPQGAFPLECAGKLMPGRYEIAGNVSSQFITGLLMALPLLDSDSEIRVIGRLESGPYVDMTIDTLADFGVAIRHTDDGFEVPGGQSFRSPRDLVIEGDWSNAAFWLAAGALGGAGVECGPLNADSAQGDRAIAAILAQFGAQVEQCGMLYYAKPAPLHAVDIDATDIPDLVPIVSVVAGMAQGDTHISGVSRLRLKESDRIESVIALLAALGVKAWERDGVLTICGAGTFTGGEINSYNDHRIAMAAAIAGTVARGPVIIHGAQASDKSYPGFFDKLTALGGCAEEV